MKKRSKSKTFLMLGGIGNQLFIYAAGIYYTHHNNGQVKFDFSIHGRGMTNHGSDIRSLNPSAIFKKRRLLFFIKSVLSKVSNRRLFSTYLSPCIGYDPNLENPILEDQILGYFQTYKYLDRPEVRTAIDSLFLNSPTTWFSQYSSELREIHTISVHVRRGDYLSLRDSFGVLSYKYYESAINLVINKSLSSYDRVLVFSDDMYLAKKAFLKVDVPIPIEFVEAPTKNHEESLMLMANSDALIMSNSSFSWWAAQLGNKSKLVICPSKWFRGIVDPEYLVPAEWHRQESQWET